MPLEVVLEEEIQEALQVVIALKAHTPTNRPLNPLKGTSLLATCSVSISLRYCPFRASLPMNGTYESSFNGITPVQIIHELRNDGNVKSFVATNTHRPLGCFIPLRYRSNRLAT